jgi:hypothetical protein
MECTKMTPTRLPRLKAGVGDLPLSGGGGASGTPLP